eukprot:CAMPEP_0170563274 /NCGR_PEP_ID=MMETSP0211-20121228/65512_1 /TAXON_ID=311385 /ORGANISM="Pseudokeronopsis sp., Strain OXSARD2" /LENGTH=48 /DNA_ID= /DNA_START= /DNA_END= /DNA_ORIENTATION=
MNIQLHFEDYKNISVSYDWDELIIRFKEKDGVFDENQQYAIPQGYEAS